MSALTAGSFSYQRQEENGNALRLYGSYATTMGWRCSGGCSTDVDSSLLRLCTCTSQLL